MAKLSKVYIAGWGVYKRHALHHTQLYIARHTLFLSMNREVQVRNPQTRAARGREGGPTSSWEEEVRRVIKTAAHQDTLAGQSAIINDYIRNSRQVFVPLSHMVGKRYAEWISFVGERGQALEVVYHDLTGEKTIFLPKSQTKIVERGGEITGLLMPGWLVRSRGLLERFVRYYLFEEVEKEREGRKKR
jgi:hypothetical protein